MQVFNSTWQGIQESLQHYQIRLQFCRFLFRMRYFFNNSNRINRTNKKLMVYVIITTTIVLFFWIYESFTLFNNRKKKTQHTFSYLWINKMKNLHLHLGHEHHHTLWPNQFFLLYNWLLKLLPILIVLLQKWVAILYLRRSKKLRLQRVFTTTFKLTLRKTNMFL